MNGEVGVADADVVVAEDLGPSSGLAVAAASAAHEVARSCDSN